MHILSKKADGVLRLQIDRPAKKNALTLAMYDELADAFETAETDRDVQVILVQGHPNAFTSGNDLADFQSSPPIGEDAPVQRFINAIRTASKPVVAAVSGVAVGIGTTMLLHFEVSYAAETTRFQLPFVNLALTPEAGSSLLLPARIGYGRAAELILLGEPFSAATALHYGLINGIAADGSGALGLAEAAAAKLAAKPPTARRLAKALMKEAAAAIAGQVRSESAAFAVQLQSPEAAEAMQAFFEKRPPNFAAEARHG